MNLKENDIESLLLSYCEGTADIREVELVEAWMAESDENRNRVMQMYKLLLADDTSRMDESLEVESVLSNVHRRMSGADVRVVSRDRRWNWGFVQKWAAILFIPVTISLLALLSRQFVAPDATMVTVSTTAGMTSSFRLPDSTLVFLNSNSKLVFPSRFTSDSRNVSLQGEAYFEVTKDADRCFVLSTLDDTKVQVLGTKFNVEAYEGAKEISTTLLEGRVNFLYRLEDGTQCVSLKPQEKVIFNTDSRSSRVVKTTCLSELAWKDGKIILDNTSLEETLRILEKRFKVEFIVRNREYLDYRFTGTFVTQRLEQILMNFKISSDIKWRFLRESPSNTEKTIVELY